MNLGPISLTVETRYCCDGGESRSGTIARVASTSVLPAICKPREYLRQRTIRSIETCAEATLSICFSLSVLLMLIATRTDNRPDTREMPAAPRPRHKNTCSHLIYTAPARRRAAPLTGPLIEFPPEKFAREFCSKLHFFTTKAIFTKSR